MYTYIHIYRERDRKRERERGRKRERERQRGKESERVRGQESKGEVYINHYVYINIYIYTQRERDVYIHILLNHQPLSLSFFMYIHMYISVHT